MRQRVGRSEAGEDTAGSVKVVGGVKERERDGTKDGKRKTEREPLIERVAI